VILAQIAEYPGGVVIEFKIIFSSGHELIADTGGEDG